jgi:hypothetical protein
MSPFSSSHEMNDIVGNCDEKVNLTTQIETIVFRRHTEAKRRATIKRVNQRQPDTIDEDEEDQYPVRQHPIVRTNTFKDPEGLDERDI